MPVFREEWMKASPRRLKTETFDQGSTPLQKTGMFGGPEVRYHQTYWARDWLSILRTPYPTQNLQRKHRTDSQICFVWTNNWVPCGCYNNECFCGLYVRKKRGKTWEWIALLSVQLPFWTLNFCEHIYNRSLFFFISSFRNFSYVYERDELKVNFSHFTLSCYFPCDLMEVSFCACFCSSSDKRCLRRCRWLL